MGITILFNKGDIRRRISIVSTLRTVRGVGESGCRLCPICVAGGGRLCCNRSLSGVSRCGSVPGLLRGDVGVGVIASKGGACVVPRRRGVFSGPGPVTIVSITFPVIRNAGIRSNTLRNFVGALGLPFINYSILSDTVYVSGCTVGIVLHSTNFPILSNLHFSVASCGDDSSVIRGARTGFNCPIIIGPMGLNSDMNVDGTSGHTRFRSTLRLTFGFSSGVLIRPTIIGLGRVGYSMIKSCVRTRTSRLRRPISTSGVLSCGSGCLSNNGGANNDGNVADLGEGVPTRVPTRATTRVGGVTIRTFGCLSYGNIMEVSCLVSSGANRF